MIGKRAFKRIIVTIIAAMSIEGCAGPNEQTDSNKRAAIEVAREYVRQNLPDQSHVLEYEAFAADRGAAWLIAFIPPGVLRTGGGPEVYVDKESLAVIKLSWGQ